MGWIYAIGFLAQLFFSARILIQWVLSERAHRIVSPSAYWICSLAGSWLLFLYGWLRDDFSIILGQLISYYIYLWNLNLKGLYRRIPLLLRAVLLLTPVAALVAIAGHAEVFVRILGHEPRGLGHDCLLRSDSPRPGAHSGSVGRIHSLCPQPPYRTQTRP